jgi:hypothetical protein
MRRFKRTGHVYWCYREYGEVILQKEAITEDKRDVLY